jgi:hypothetical protein
MKTIKSLLAASIATAVLAPSLAMAGGAGDNDARIAALEAQIAELKAMMSGQIQEQQVLASRVETVSKSAKTGPGYDVKIGGYIKADLTWTKASNGDPNNVGFYFPTQIPVGADGSGEGAAADMTVAESRINFSATRELDGHTLTFFTEMDFYGGGGNEIATNSIHPRLRHAFIKYDNWLIGQTWSTFQDVSALAENLDFIGPAEGTTFVRQTQVRYTNGGLQLAIENTNTRLNNGGTATLTDDGAIPDIVAKYTFKGDYGHVAVAGIYRDLTWETATDEYSDTGLGISVSGKLNVGDSGDDFRFMVTSGSGVGRYLGITGTPGAVFNADSNDIEAIDSTGGFVSYRHLWNSQWRSNLTYSIQNVDNDVALTGDGAIKDLNSIHVNLLYSPTAKVTFGAEYMTAERELESGHEGDFDRLQFSAKYAF